MTAAQRAANRRPRLGRFLAGASAATVFLAALTLAPRPASAAVETTGGAPLHLSFPTTSGGLGFDVVAGQEFALPAGLITVTAAPIASGPATTETTQVRLGPCGAVPTSGPVDVVLRPSSIAANTRLVPAGWCAVADRSVALAAEVNATSTADVNEPAYFDIDDVELAPITTTRFSLEIPLSLDAIVPPEAVAVALVATSRFAGAEEDAGNIEPCVPRGQPIVTIGSGGTRSALVVAQFSRPDAVPSHLVCLVPRHPRDGEFPMTFTVVGYFAPGAGSSPYVLPEFRYQGLGAPSFVPLTPTRLFDTREVGAPVEAGAVHVLDLSVLDRSVSALVLNVTVTAPEGNGFVTVFPCDVTLPTASSLNYRRGQTIANQVTVGLLAQRQLCFFTQARAHLVADLAGTYDLGRGDGFDAVAPTRLFDSRLTGTAVPAGTVRRLDLRGAVPDDASAVTVNVTATSAVNPGFVTVFPCDETQPVASNLNYDAGSTVANLVTVKVGASRELCFYVHGTTHLFADLSGWYRPGVVRGFIDNVPDRVFDTRSDLPSRVPGGEFVYVTWNASVDAVVLNVTVTDPAAPGFVTVYPCASGRPTASNINYVVGQTVPNAVVVKPDDDHRTCFYAHGATHLVGDITGFFSSRLDYAYDNVAG